MAHLSEDLVRLIAHACDYDSRRALVIPATAKQTHSDLLTFPLHPHDTRYSMLRQMLEARFVWTDRDVNNKFVEYNCRLNRRMRAFYAVTDTGTGAERKKIHCVCVQYTRFSRWFRTEVRFQGPGGPLEQRKVDICTN
jgi:hypothetical protein